MGLWQWVPQVRVLPHVIYLEWIVCLGVFLTVPLFDRRRIASRHPTADYDVPWRKTTQDHVLGGPQRS